MGGGLIGGLEDFGTQFADGNQWNCSLLSPCLFFCSVVVVSAMIVNVFHGKLDLLI